MNWYLNGRKLTSIFLGSLLFDSASLIIPFSGNGWNLISSCETKTTCYHLQYPLTRNASLSLFHRILQIMKNEFACQQKKKNIVLIPIITSANTPNQDFIHSSICIVFGGIWNISFIMRFWNMQRTPVQTFIASNLIALMKNY